MNSISLRGISFSFGDRSVFDAVSLQLSGITAVLGPSGCGKTTLLRLLMGQLVPTAGTISPNPDSFRRGVVFQEPRLLPWRTVRQNIDLVCSGACDDRRDFWLNRVGLAAEGETLPLHLSGGMRQRVALVRALVTDPELLLIDEPLTGLDAAQSGELSALLAETLREARRTAVVVTHDIDLALGLADRIVVLPARPGDAPVKWERAESDDETLRTAILATLGSGSPGCP